jgi:hypothetical protein
LNGGRGTVPVGPTGGTTGGLRYEYQISQFFVFTSSVAYAQATAYYYNTRDSVPTRRGPVNDNVVLIDWGLQAALTGAKTFHGFQPFVGGALGLASAPRIGADSSGYKFGTKLTVTPEIGLRWFPTTHLSLEMDYRMVHWKLTYPLSYRSYLIPALGNLIDWTTQRWVSASLGWTF